MPVTVKAKLHWSQELELNLGLPCVLEEIQVLEPSSATFQCVHKQKSGLETEQSGLNQVLQYRMWVSKMVSWLLHQTIPLSTVIALCEYLSGIKTRELSQHSHPSLGIIWGFSSFFYSTSID